MWIKKKSRVNSKGEGLKSRRGAPPPPLAGFEEHLHKATKADDESALPNVAVIAADTNGRYEFNVKRTRFHKTLGL
jgi:hypothetical protein